MTLCQGHDTIVWNIIKIQLGSEELWPGHGFGYECTVTLTFEIWPWVKIMKRPWVMDNNCVKYYQDQIWQLGVMAQTRIPSMRALWPWPWVKVMIHHWIMDNNCVKYYQDPIWQWGVKTRIRILGMCVLWHWPWRYDHGQGHDTPLSHGQQLCQILSRSNVAVRT